MGVFALVALSFSRCEAKVTFVGRQKKQMQFVELKGCRNVN
jgi:hypothetical protein